MRQLWVVWPDVYSAPSMGEPMRVVVVGAGISGLTTAFRIKERAEAQGRALSLTVLESGPQAGGTIRTVARDGFRCEAGPNGFLDSKPETMQLVSDLGLTGQLLRSDDAARRRFVMVNGGLIELPSSPGGFMKSPLLSFASRMRVVREMWVAKRTDGADETVAEFASRRLGPQAYARLVDPFVSGIFAGDPNKLSLKAAFPRLAELEAEYGSLLKAS
ncbi:MAG: oxygen-dependent protoporphyrinogen oxidase, partial [Myxococcota bacterium]